MREERQRRAALRLQAWRQGVGGRKRAAAARAVRDELQLRALEFDALMAAVRAENERAALARACVEHECRQAFEARAATLLQARHRGTAARRRGAKLAAAKQGEAERKAAPSVDLTAV